MSPRAACRLDTLGFEQVYDYMPGRSTSSSRRVDARSSSRAVIRRGVRDTLALGRHAEVHLVRRSTDGCFRYRTWKERPGTADRHRVECDRQRLHA